MNILHIPYQKIDRTKWDRCVQNDPTGIPYAQTDLLDILCEDQWSGMVAGDYEFVMPLPYNLKYIFFPQVYQPMFFQQGGIFGSGEKPEGLVHNFLQAIPSKYRRLIMSIKSDNPVNATYYSSKKQNFILSLAGGMEQVRNNYHRSLKRRVKIAQQTDLKLFEQNEPGFNRNQFYFLIKEYFIPLSEELKKIGENNVLKKIERFLSIETARPFLVVNREDEPMACCLCIASESRSTLIITATSPEGRAADATHFLIDSILEKFVDLDFKFFDFEGSSIPGVAEFYRQFGAIHEEFSIIKRMFGRWKA